MKKLFVSFVLCLIAFNGFCADNVKTYIPAKAYTYAPVLKVEQQKFWPDHPQPWLLGGLVEQESCISLRHSRCWDPKSQLKTQREEGAGLYQTTRAYTKSGALRFDTLAALQKQFPALAELSWDNVYQRPDLQLRSGVLLNRTNYKALSTIKDPTQRLSLADAAYNSGLGSVQNRRRACGMKAGCDPQQWFGHVEKICLTGNVPLYGQRTACDINREHVLNVMKVRSFKYKQLMS